MAVSIFCFVFSTIIAINVALQWKLIQNNNDLNDEYNAVGTWDSWMTGYHVNDLHDGYLDIGSISFNAANFQEKYSIETNCSNTYSLFANGRIYCTSSNILLSYYPDDGSISFWYLNIGSTTKAPTFTSYGSTSEMSIFIYSYSASKLHTSLFDAMTGTIKSTDSLPVYSSYYSPYAVGTPFGQVYITSKNTSSVLTNASLNAYNIQNYQFVEGPKLIQGAGEVAVICNNLAIVSGYYAYTDAFLMAPDFEHQWYWPGEGISTSYSSPPPPVCIKNENGYRVIVKPYSTVNYDCYLLDTFNGELLDEFQCGTMPIFHYNDDAVSDVAIMGSGVVNQILAVEINGDKIVYKELWFGDGNVDHGFIVKDYFITATKPDYYTVIIKVYNVYNGEVIWTTQFEELPSSVTYSVFGGLYENKDNNNNIEFMLVVRIGNDMYAYVESEM